MNTAFRLIRGIALACALYLCLPSAAFAQGLGTINGTVVDSTGASVPGATVVLTEIKTGQTTTVQSHDDGLFVFPSVPPSNYKLDVSSKGFQNYDQTGILLQADQSLTINVPLQIGSETQTVTVEANAAQINVTSGGVSQVIGEQQVIELPLNGRNAASLTTLVAGVVTAPNAGADQGATKTFPSAVTISANGTRVGQTNYLLDGGNNVDEYTNVNAPFPMPDAVQEFSVATSNYNAEYGQNAGGVVNIITKSGGNKFHGDLFEFVRNRAFNAANYFSYVNGVKTVDPLKRNQFGGTVGGPVEIPGLFKNKHTFFFVGYQKTIAHTSSVSATADTLPTADQLAGNFNFTSAAAPGTTAFNSACIANPSLATTPANAAQCYPYTANGGNSYTAHIPTTAFNKSSLALLKYLPTPDANGSFTFVKPNFTSLGEVTARVDQDLTSKDRLTARYFSDGYSLQGVLNLQNLLTYADSANIHYYNALLSETHTFSDHILNNLIVSYQLEQAGRGPLPGSINVNDLGVNIWQPDFKQINQILVGTTSATFFNIGDNPQGTFNRANYTLGDDVHIQAGSHNIAVGFHGEQSKVDVNNLYQQPGLFTFNATVTNDAIASFLTGYVQQFSQASGQFLNLRGHFFGFYGQDAWKIGRRFTLTYGVRYEPFLPWHEKEGRMGSFFPDAYASNTHSTVFPLAPAGLKFAGDPGFNPNGVPNIYTHFMPRIGFAWDVFGDGKTSLHGGGGSFYDSRMSSVFYNIYSNTSPFITNFNVSSVLGSTTAGNTVINFSDPYGSTGSANPFPAAQPPLNTSPIPTQAFLTYDPFRPFATPITYSYNLTLEQQITNNLLTRIAYVGSHSSHQWVPVDINPTLNADAVPVNDPRYNRRLYNPTGCSATNSCYTQSITEANMGGNASYNSLQFSAEQRMRSGLTILANYTWSKAIDSTAYNQSSTAIASSSSYVFPIYEPNFKRLDHGPSDFDHTHVASISFVYEVPKVLKDAPGAVRYIVNGWQASGLFQTRSGDPLTILAASSNIDGSSQNRDRAVLIPGVNPYGGTACGTTAHCKNGLNPAAFANPTANPAAPGNSYGNIAKGSFRGPRYTDVDMALTRNFAVTSRAALQVRAEYFNLFNHTNFGDPNTTLGGPFGRITGTTPQNGASANDPRIAQFSAKLVF
ncbi:carboxypeptidase regulatory-like domain-containing protein [Granulicella sp. WH15]|uniref:carboxypeptidase regulatory-like domain-containing protein n=1 Tax=Granulicella sp. WH15 TaxID=2602070 RepID=UPI00136700E6|nr:carboxypeptidase regulatory-like domain-containing protein [Granulicella sp. WH15]QHN04964.1 carboxypeptidase regulatory-like domain-containing protein [Granulicella sp. WH15]